MDKEKIYLEDEIMSNQQNIKEIENKLNMLNFFNSVDKSVGQSLNLDEQELNERKKEIEGNLRILLNKVSNYKK